MRKTAEFSVSDMGDPLILTCLVYIDEHLTFETHIVTKANKANSTMGLIRRSFTYLDEEIFVLLFKALVRPHLEYAQPVWSPYLKKHQQMIENVHRQSTKLIPGFKTLSYEERFEVSQIKGGHDRGL